MLVWSSAELEFSLPNRKRCDLEVRGDVPYLRPCDPDRHPRTKKEKTRLASSACVYAAVVLLCQGCDPRSAQADDPMVVLPASSNDVDPPCHPAFDAAWGIDVEGIADARGAVAIFPPFVRDTVRADVRIVYYLLRCKPNHI